MEASDVHSRMTVSRLILVLLSADDADGERVKIRVLHLTLLRCFGSPKLD